jgi:HK97 family phage prohead protease
MTTRAPDIEVVRNLSARLEVRAIGGGDGSLGLLSGHFSVFNTWYQVDSMWEGTFLERTAPGAFAQTIADDLDDMRVLFDHGFDPQIGNKVLGPIESLSEDDTGPAYEVPLFDTSYNRDLLPGLRAVPSVYGSSFRFQVTAESWVDEPGPVGLQPAGLAGAHHHGHAGP